MDVKEKNRRRMAELLEELATLDGVRDSLLDGVKFVRSGCSVGRIPVMYEPCIVIVAQGRKRGYLGDQRFVYDVRNYLTLTLPLPFECETEVGEDGPFLAVVIRIELGLLHELIMSLGEGLPSEAADHRESSVTATPMDAALSDAAIRLLECLRVPADARVLGPQIVREIVYRVLRGRRGGALQSLMRMDATRMQLHRLMHRMHSEYAKSFDVTEAALRAGMSVSALHHHFKAMTGTSPLKYLKFVRLHKARMLMVQNSLGAAMAAERVGYESASQFSREFKRLFGTPPIDETERLRGLFGLSAKSPLPAMEPAD